jgi:hypothetical protein
MSNDENLDPATPQDSDDFLANPDTGSKSPDDGVTPPDRPDETPEDIPSQTTPETPVVNPPENPEDSANPADDEAKKKAEEDAEAARAKALQARQEEIEKLKAEREAVAKVAEELTDAIKVKEEAAAEFADWVNRHSRTFLWKMVAKMKENLAAIAEKQAAYRDLMANIKVPQPGELIRLRKRFHKTVLSAILGGLLIWLVYFLITAYLPFAWVLKLTSLGSMIFRYVLSGVIVIIVSALMLYYRDWRKFDWSVKTLNHELKEVTSGVDKVRQEEVRLVSLYPQVMDWLEIIGYSLNRPWTMNDRWFRSYLSDLNQDEFPFSLRIAQAQERDAASMHALTGSTMKRYAIRGWRTKVLKDQILAIAQKVGLPLERMNVEGIDQDIAYSPGGPRVELRKGLENQEALELVARRQLVPLTFKVQSEEITKSRPPVKENRTNRLDVIQADQAGLEEEERVDWDKFLQEPIGPFNGVVTPFSLASLAPGEIMRGYHENLTSHFVVPERLKELAKQNPGARVETYLETANLPMDIVIRMDLSMPMSPHALKINPKESSSEVPASYVSPQASYSPSNLADEDDDDDDD